MFWSVFFTIICVLVLAVIWEILYETHHFRTVSYEITSDKISGDFRIVMLSDLHDCRYGKHNELLLKAVEDAKPDAVCIAGDMIVSHKKAKPEETFSFLKELSKRYPVYYAYGNHEHKPELFKERYGDLSERFDKAMEEAGIKPLRNASVFLEEKNVRIYGFEADFLYYKRFHIPDMEADYVQSLLGPANHEEFTLLLAHNPAYFERYAGWGADLTLSGHVHGGIVRIPFWGKGVINPAMNLFPKYDGGRFENGNAVMILGRGIGNHAPSIRLFNPAELVVVDFKRTSAENKIDT